MLLHLSHVTLKSLNAFSTRLDGLVNVLEMDSWRQVQPGQVKDGVAAIEVQQLQQSSVLQVRFLQDYWLHMNMICWLHLPCIFHQLAEKV